MTKVLAIDLDGAYPAEILIWQAVIIQAAEDYIMALNKLLAKPHDKDKWLRDKEVLEIFFHSEYYSMITNIHPDWMISELQKSVGWEE